jgi:hypothetical protein
MPATNINLTDVTDEYKFVAAYATSKACFKAIGVSVNPERLPPETRFSLERRARANIAADNLNALRLTSASDAKEG